MGEGEARCGVGLEQGEEIACGKINASDGSIRGEVGGGGIVHLPPSSGTVPETPLGNNSPAWDRA